MAKITFQEILDKYRKKSFSEADKGTRFERLMQAYLQTDPQYAPLFKSVWLWSEFPGRKDSGSGQDTGIDLVALTHEGDYWAIQCKCYGESAYLDKPAVDSFLSTSSKTFKNEALETTKFAHRLWISTTNHWGKNAEDALKNQHPPVTRINLTDLQEAAVDWEKMEKGIHGEASRAPKKPIFAHIWEVQKVVHEYFQKAERGKLIMACGTGKTIASLKIAEKETGGKGTILFLVPSIALLGQTLHEWSNQADEPINAVCICSDPEVSKTKTKNEDADTFSVVDLALPASTNPKQILHQFQQIKKTQRPGMTVVFSTYQSIEVISRAQKELLKNGFEPFDLIICDEAHRTTGVALKDEDESAFTKVHNNDFIQAKKRLYMTATPRLYDDNAKSKAAQAEAILCSMDDVELYGEEIHRIGFGEAVERNLLSDYKVLVLTMNEENVPPAVQKMFEDSEHKIEPDDLSKLIGCINGLSKQILGDEGLLQANDPEPMRRAVAFCQRISDSKAITEMFNESAGAYLGALPPENRTKTVAIESQHIDGTMSAPTRDEKISWLKADSGENHCRVLTNVRCLSEGVDVPSLDAVLFLSARNSQVDVVQSVGRVMRKAPGKKFGYIIIPIVVPSDVEPETALNDNKRYNVVWTVLNALRAHDDRFNAMVNKIELNKQKPNNVLVGKGCVSFDENGNAIQSEKSDNAANAEIARQLEIKFKDLQSVIFARMVKKVGDRRYWEQWARDVAVIAQRQIETINYLLKVNVKHAAAFDEFLDGLQTNINPSVTREEAIEMLAQHMITRPVFEALFEGDSFVNNNVISQSMQKMLELLETHSLGKESETLQKFYDSVKMRAKVDNAGARQTVILELYDNFFRTAFPKMVEKLGIVYTPVEVVDFILHSVDGVLQQEFGRGLSDENVHILDPFTGTGTFITRLLQSGLIKQEDLKRKYQKELHANEIVLLAYYIAAVNIENVYHDLIRDIPVVDGAVTNTPQPPSRGELLPQHPNSPLEGNTPNSPLEGGRGVFPAARHKNKIIPYNPVLKEKARELRKNSTLSEVLLWQKIQNKQLGFQFHRQVPMDQFIVDFYCHELMLAIEIDGISHEGRDEPDQVRQRKLEEFGVRFLRFSDKEVKTNLRGVLSTLEQWLNEHKDDLAGVESAAKNTPLNPPSRGELGVFSSRREFGYCDENSPLEGGYGGVVTHQPFEGILLTDTFQLNESEVGKKYFSEMFPENSQRVQKQRSTPIRVIMSNPPYSVGQKSANDNAQNQKYETLDARIAATYAKGTNATNKNSLYDAYIKAFRWSADRLDKEHGGVIAFVTNGSWLDGNATSGFRKCLEEEFSSIWVFNLRGNQRTSGETSRREGGKIFGSGSRTPIAITLLVKKPFPPSGDTPEDTPHSPLEGGLRGVSPERNSKRAVIHYHDIGDYLSRDDKLKIISRFAGVTNPEMLWQTIAPNEEGDWISQRSDVFGTFISIGERSDKATYFKEGLYCRGLETSRDSWVYNSNLSALQKNVHTTIDFYNAERKKFSQLQNSNAAKPADFVSSDEKSISWSRAFLTDIAQNHVKKFEESSLRVALYRPFFKQHLYFNRELNNVVSRMDSFFPTPEHKNLLICVSGLGGSKPSSSIISDCIVDLNCLDAGTQCFPLYYYETRDKTNKSLFDGAAQTETVRRDGVSDFILERARAIYGKSAGKEDIFYYVYGLLHSADYRAAFGDDLKKMLPRIPLVDEPKQFWQFSKAGRALADLHINYESVPAAESVTINTPTDTPLPPSRGEFGCRDEKSPLKGGRGVFSVQKMRFPQKGEKSSIIYNSHITVENIPAKAYEYVVNGKSAIEWIMERYQVTTHKDSGICNDPNDWASEVGNPRYILDLLLSVINLSVQTVDIVNGLPKLKFE